MVRPRAVTACRCSAAIRDIRSGRARGRVESIAFSPNDGANVLAGCADGTLKLWNTKTGRIIQSVRAHSTSVTSVAYSPDGTHILSGGYDGTLNLWNAATGLLIHSFKGHSRAVSSVAF